MLTALNPHPATLPLLPTPPHHILIPQLPILQQELERLVCGNPNLDFAALERHAKYDGGFSKETQAVLWLWQIVRELDLVEQRCFLKFFTGSDRAPIGGLGNMKCVI